MTEFNINNAPFIGKFSFSFKHDNQVFLLCFDEKKGLGIQAGDANSPATNQMFNLYGDFSNGFVMQAPNWLYIGLKAGYYEADRIRTDADCSVFRLQTNVDDGSVSFIQRMQDFDAFYLYVHYPFIGNDVKLSYIIFIKDSKPTTLQVRFGKNQITAGVAEIVSQRTTNAKPLTGAYLSGNNLNWVLFQNTDLSYADLSHTTLMNSSWKKVTASNTNFDHAFFPGTIAYDLTFSNCSFYKADLSETELYRAVFTGCMFHKAMFTTCKMPDADFTGAAFIDCNCSQATISGVNFKNANLTNTDFSKAVGVDQMKDITGATLIGVDLSGHDLRTCLIDAHTNFISAILEGCNFIGHDLSNVVFFKAKMKNAKLDNTILNGVQMPFADLSFASVTGAVSMTGANLANANLQGAQFPGAQLGAKKTLYTLPLSDGTLLDNQKIPADLQAGLKLSAQATVTIIQPGHTWKITDGQHTFGVSNTGTGLLVQATGSISNAAVLTNAYMENTNFAQANMYAAEMSGVYWFGSNASAENADLGEATLDNSFLANMQFKQTKLQGATFAYSRLIGTVFDGAQLGPDTNLKPNSFAFSSMQSASFTGTNVFYANLTNAAFGLEKGVPLFTIEDVPGITLDSIIASLDNKALSDNLRTAFKTVSYPLINSSRINVNTAGSSWTINNIDAENASQAGYGNFNLELKKNSRLNHIQVYGAPPLLLLTADGNGGQSQMPLPFGPTGINQDQLNDDTTCPSGMKFSYLNNNIGFEEIMTAVLPPQPPDCLTCWDNA